MIQHNAPRGGRNQISTGELAYLVRWWTGSAMHASCIMQHSMCTMHLAISDGLWFRLVLLGMAGGRILDAVEHTQASIRKFKWRHTWACKHGYNIQPSTEIGFLVSAAAYIGHAPLHTHAPMHTHAQTSKQTTCSIGIANIRLGLRPHAHDNSHTHTQIRNMSAVASRQTLRHKCFQH